ncbi:hypothetical protein [Tomitella fengzijianii]|uniref:DUF1214 domain-containing protein n=1 Tax=Tomitella fengzijianii TaxID=2597660 RepID=A0A516X4E0_9ACTN|nr:hypothetical protein [Tomitella fengzijianii]QDQ97521.1 hypothetical protein FO059_09505 [Tomitella fengzijianii]
MHDPTAPDAQAPLPTDAQLRFERAGLELLDDPLIRAARDDVRRMYEADPQAATDAGRATLEPAVDAATLASVHMALHDPARPALVWTACAPHAWCGLRVPGSGYGIDNPDNIHRHAVLDGDATYLIRGELPARPPAQQSFVLYGQTPGTGAVTKEGAPVQGALTDAGFRIDGGRFTVTVGPGDGAGDTPHLRTTPGRNFLISRNALTDWTTQLPARLTIEQIDGPAPKSPAPGRTREHAAELVRTVGRYWLEWDNAYIFSKPANAVTPPPGLRASGFGCATSGHFRLEPGQALVVRVDRLAADYVGFQVTDPWGVAREHVARSGSINSAQAVPDDDGLYTYAICAEDPGVANWLDTGGLGAGIYAIRWQGLPAGADASRAVRGAEVVDGASVPSVVDPAERAAANAARVADYRRRMFAWE